MFLSKKIEKLVTIILALFLVKCDRNPFGNYDNSLTDPNFHPGTETINNTVVNQTIYAFITNQGGSSVTKCTINSSDGSLFNCLVITNSTSYGFTTPWGITYSNGYLYISNSLSGSTAYELCAFDSNSGNTTSCLANTYSIAGSIRAMATTIFNSKAYIPNYDGNNVVVCSLSSTDGSLISCNTTGTNLTTPHGIFLSANYAYVANYSGQNITICNLNSVTGTFSGCSITGRAYGTPVAGIEINNNNAYITMQSANSIDLCPVNPSTGVISNICSTAINSGLSGPNSIKILNGIAYITNYTSPIGTGLMKCNVSSSDGTFSNCVSTGSNFNQPTWITFSN